MPLSLDKPKLDNLVGDIWKSAERLRSKFRGYEYPGVILPIIVIRRLECVLIVWGEAKRAEVLAKRPALTAYRKSLVHECVTGQRRITAAELDRVRCA